MEPIPFTEVAPEAGTSAPSIDTATAQLTARLKNGDDEAFRQFHEQYFDRLHSFLIVVARGREQDAEEALRETMLRVVRYARVFSREEIFWSWLKAVARSAARDGGRERKRYANLLERFGIFRTVTHLEREAHESSAQAVLSDLVGELPLAERQLLEEKYMAGDTIREIAARNALTEKAVECRLNRLRQRLRERLLEELHKS